LGWREREVGNLVGQMTDQKDRRETNHRPKELKKGRCLLDDDRCNKKKEKTTAYSASEAETI